MNPTDKILVSAVSSASTILQRRQNKQHHATLIKNSQKEDGKDVLVEALKLSDGKKDLDTSTRGPASSFRTLRRTTTKMRTRFQFPTFLIFILFTLLLVTVQAAPTSDDSEHVSTKTQKSTDKPTSTTKDISTTHTDKASTSTKDSKDAKSTSKSVLEVEGDDEDDHKGTMKFLPKNIWPFDTNLGANFTDQSCPDFINAFVSSDAYRECMPLSPLIQVCSLLTIPT
jgi:hypothetical protein